MLNNFCNVVDEALRKIWAEDIAEDYKKGYLLREDSLKCALYFHLRNYLTDDWLKENKIRIFTEFPEFPSKLKATKLKPDISIVKMKTEFDPKHKSLLDSIESVLVIIEIKFKNRAANHKSAFDQDCEKLFEYTSHKQCKAAQLYGCFIFEEIYKDEPLWFANYKNVKKFISYWDENKQLVRR